LAILLLLLLAPPLGAEDLNRVVLRINDRIATLYDFEKRRADTLQDMLRREQDPAERTKLAAQIGEIVFGNLFQDLLLESRADQLGIETSDAQMEAEITRIKKSFGIETDEQFHEALAQSGMTEEGLRERLRNDLRVRSLMGQEVSSRVQLKEEDLRRYYRKHQEDFRLPEQRQLKEVVVLDQGGLPNAEERARIAGEIRQQTLAGKKFDEVVTPYVAAGWVSKVADLGWVSPHDLDATLEAAVWKLAPGSLSEAISGRGGLHILQVVDRRDSRIPPFSEVSQQIEAKEQNRVYSEEMRKYMAELEQHSLIVAHPPEEAKNFRRRLGTNPEPTSLGGGGVAAAPNATTGAEAPATATAPAAPPPPSQPTDAPKPPAR